MEQDDFLARKEQILNRNSAKNFKEFNIENELKKLPAKPGVYLMHDASDEIIYVGKAIKLCNRVRQYFQRSKKPSAKIEQMVSHVSYFEYIVTDSEMEALILECNLIKKHRPRYNTMLMDDRHTRILELQSMKIFQELCLRISRCVIRAVILDHIRADWLLRTH